MSSCSKHVKCGTFLWLFRKRKFLKSRNIVFCVYVLRLCVSSMDHSDRLRDHPGRVQGWKSVCWWFYGFIFALWLYGFMDVWYGFVCFYGFMVFFNFIVLYVIVLWFYSVVVLWFYGLMVSWFQKITKFPFHAARKSRSHIQDTQGFCHADFHHCSVPVFSTSGPTFRNAEFPQQIIFMKTCLKHVSLLLLYRLKYVVYLHP